MKQETLTNYLKLRSEVRNRAFEVFKKINNELYLANGSKNKDYIRLEKIIDEEPDCVSCTFSYITHTNQIFTLSYRGLLSKSSNGNYDLLEFECSTEFMWDEEKLNQFIKTESEEIKNNIMLSNLIADNMNKWIVNTKE